MNAIYPTELNNTKSDSIKAELEDFVFGAFKAHDAQFGDDAWPWETERWHELVFSILATIGEPRISSEDARDLVQSLVKWRLLDMDSLLIDPDSGTGSVPSDTATIRALLAKAGFGDADADLALDLLRAVARTFREEYGGKVQLFFRRHGLRMVNELASPIDIPESEAKILRQALATWLQNTLNMPLPTHDKAVARFCEDNEIEYADLVNAADAIGFNVALMDDALRILVEEESGEEPEHLMEAATEETRSGALMPEGVNG